MLTTVSSDNLSSGHNHKLMFQLQADNNSRHGDYGMKTTATLNTNVNNSQSTQMTSLMRVWFLTSFVILPLVGLCSANDVLTIHPTTPTAGWGTVMSATHYTAEPAPIFQTVYYSKEKFKHYRDSCARVQRFAVENCQRSKYSCVSRCGEASTSDRYMCSCDPYCTVYQDCCWDFATQCPVERNNAQHHILHSSGDIDISCINNKKIIVGCGNNTENRTPGPVDHREPLVFVDGFFFMNRSTMRNFLFGEEPVAEKIILFPVKGIAIALNESVAILQSFFLNGHKEGGVNIFEFLSKWPPFRVCSPPVIVDCDFGADLKWCYVPHKMLIDDSSVLCDHDTIMDSNEFPDSLSDVSTPFTQQGRHRCNIRPAFTNYIPTSGVIVTVSYEIADNSYTISDIIVPKRSDFFNRHLKSITCDKTTLSRSCTIRINCIRGFLPVSFVCREPHSIAVQVYGENRYSVLKRLQIETLSLIFKYNPWAFDLADRKLLPNREVKVESGHMSITEYIGIHRLFLDYDGEILPVTKKVLEMLQDKDALLHVQTISICVGIKRLDGLEECLLCDRLWTGSTDNPTFLDHRTISGSQLPNPFSDVVKPVGSRSQDHCTTSPLFVMIFCQSMLYII